MATTEKMSERQFQTMVLLLFKTYGWKASHFGNTVKYVRRGDGYKVIPDIQAAGFPDIVAIRDGRLLFAELKSSTGTVRKNQQEWLDALAMSHAEVYVWRPQDLEEIQRVINRRTS